MIGITVSLLALITWSIIATIEVVARDGYGPIPVRPLSDSYSRSLAR